MAVTTVASIGFNRWGILGHCTHADGRRVTKGDMPTEGRLRPKGLTNWPQQLKN